MTRSLIVQTAPTTEPIDVTSVKDYRRIDGDDEDILLDTLIKAARHKFEQKYSLALQTQTLVLGLDCFPFHWAWTRQPDFIHLRGPVQSVTSITYLDPSGAQQTLAATEYIVDTSSMPGRVYPKVGKVWPTTAALPGAVKVTFVAGYASPHDVPGDIQEALHLYVGHLYENRESVAVDSRLIAVEIPQGIADIMAAYAPALVA